MITSSTSSGLTLARSSAPLIATLPRSCAGTAPNAPLNGAHGRARCASDDDIGCHEILLVGRPDGHCIDRPSNRARTAYLDHRTVITERLLLRPITLDDADRLAVLHADARVMNLLQHGVLTRAESDAMVADYAAEWPALGFGSWTATERASGQLVGLGGLRVHGEHGVALRAAFTPEAQGRGLRARA